MPYITPTPCKPVLSHPESFYISHDPYPHLTPSELRFILLKEAGCPSTSKKTVNDPTALSAFPTITPPPSPPFSVRRGILNETSEEAQALRSKLIHGADVVVVQGGSPDKEVAYLRLKKLGVKVHLLDDPESTWADRVGQDDLFASFTPVDLASPTVGEDARSALASHCPKMHPHAVTTYYEDAVAIAANIALALDVRGTPVQAAEKARNKQLTRDTLRKAGLPSPRFARILNASDLQEAAHDVGFPAVLKPSFGAASMGVVRVDCVEDLVRAYNQVIESMDEKTETIWRQGNECLLEEYYDGDEFDVDLLLSEGLAVYAKVSDNWAIREPWFQETGMHCPSSYPAKKQGEMVALAVDASKALGFEAGCLHVECRYTSRGPRIIEVNGRMGGDPVYEFNRLVWGVDLAEEHCMAVMGIPIRPTVSSLPLCHIAEFAFNAPYSGTMESEDWLDFLRKDHMVWRIKYFKKKGAKAIGPEDGVPDWLAEIILIGHTNQRDVNNRVQEIVQRDVAVPIAPNKKGNRLPFFFPSDQHPFSLSEELDD